MTAMQAEIGLAYNIPDRPRSGPEYPMTAPFPVESRARHQTPDAGPRFRARRSDPNAPSSSEAGASDAHRLLQVPEPRWPAEALAVPADGANTGDAYRPFHTPEPGWLADALAELAEVDDEIAEEELPPVDEATKTEAERIIKDLAWRHPLAPTIYPTQDTEIAIHFKSPDRPDVVVILLNNSGQANCHAYIGGRGRRSHYNTSSDLPDAFLLDQLRRLTPPGWAAVSTPDAKFHLFGTTFLLTNLLRTR